MIGSCSSGRFDEDWTPFTEFRRELVGATSATTTCARLMMGVPTRRRAVEEHGDTTKLAED